MSNKEYYVLSKSDTYYPNPVSRSGIEDEVKYLLEDRVDFDDILILTTADITLKKTDGFKLVDMEYQGVYRLSITNICNELLSEQEYDTILDALSDADDWVDDIVVWENVTSEMVWHTDHLHRGYGWVYFKLEEIREN